MRRLLAAAAASAALAASSVWLAGAASADGCGHVGNWGGQCDFNFAPDGSHEHCDSGWAPFVGNFQNCYWVNTRP